MKMLPHVPSWFFICLSLLMLTLAATSEPNTTAAPPANTTDTSHSILKAPNITKRPDCPSRCGTLTVPYPFGLGIGQDCAIEPRFEINCSYSFNPPKAFIRRGNIQVHDISDTQIRVSTSVGKQCYDPSGNIAFSSTGWTNLGDNPYSYSDANKFFLISCNAVGYIGTDVNWTSYTGCVSYCSKAEDMVPGSCSGLGCCQVPIPKLQRFYINSFGSSKMNMNINSSFSCSYGFLGEPDHFTFGGAKDLLDPGFLNRTRANVSIVLDWAIGNLTCQQAQQLENYPCKANSYCVNSETSVGGYRCRCLQGYEGNPYLGLGCTDVNECEDPNINKCERCSNLPGSFSCSCPPGYSGDGKKGSCTRKSPVITFSLVGGTSFGILFLATASFWSYKIMRKRMERKRKEKFFKRNGGLLMEQQLLVDKNLVDKVRFFTSSELDKATDNFNQIRVLGHGGQGTVYKGMLVDGKIVAIKRSKLAKENQVEEFINEVVILSQINHRNVVKLLGCCLETEVPLLVYEFIPNETLYDLIHNENDEFLMSWDVRLRIAIEVSRALAYLHSATSIPVYHRDIKSSNILLDEKHRVKVSDFGISRHVTIEQTHLTTVVKGTFGYLDPEYFQSNQFTEKSDVYSFGVVLVELLTRQKPISSNHCTVEGGGLSLATRFLMSMEEDKLSMILDNQIVDTTEKQVKAVAVLAKRCLNLNGRKRPTMNQIAAELESLKTSHYSSTVETNFQESKDAEAELVIFSDGIFSSTTANGTIATSSDAYPLLSDTFRYQN